MSGLLGHPDFREREWIAHPSLVTMLAMIAATLVGTDSRASAGTTFPWVIQPFRAPAVPPDSVTGCPSVAPSVW
ncbi:hypothetical protein [Micromonospora noduli]|uniref:hypothetical protein n=1 Tax=Micromonospora noduli TaxID=709876 RepID=UPI000DDA78D9|nr:hypothetical protein [Micromonospora noduli]